MQVEKEEGASMRRGDQDLKSQRAILRRRQSSGASAVTFTSIAEIGMVLLVLWEH